METKFSDLVGKTLVRIDGGKGSAELTFHTTDGESYQMWHQQDCCETVYLDDIIGDLDDLIGTPIVKAEARSNSDDPPVKDTDASWGGTYTWTFYELATLKGYVTLRWYGTSNGYYSESVSFVKLNEGSDYES